MNKWIQNINQACIMPMGNSNHWRNNEKCKCELKNVIYVKKWKYVKFMWKYLASIMGGSAINCDEVFCHTRKKQILTKKKATWKTQNFYILLAFLLSNIALFIAVSIYCYLRKYWAKKSIYYHFTLKIYILYI